MCLACWCSHSSRLLALMWFARWVLTTYMGSTPVTPECSSCSGIAIVRRRCGDHPVAKPFIISSGRHARLRSILGGAMASLIDATVDHEDPGDPRGLVGNRDRRLLGRHAAEQLRDPGMLVRAFLRLTHNGHRAVNK